MKEVMEYVKVRYLSERGQGIVEYALILAFVVVLAAYLASSGELGKAVTDTFGGVADKLNTANGAGGGN